MSQCLSLWIGLSAPAVPATVPVAGTPGTHISPFALADGAFVIICDCLSDQTVSSVLTGICGISCQSSGVDRSSTVSVFFADRDNGQQRKLYPVLSSVKEVSICPFSFLARDIEFQSSSGSLRSPEAPRKELVELMNFQVQSELRCPSIELDFVTIVSHRCGANVDYCVGVSSVGQLVIHCSAALGAEPETVDAGLLTHLVQDCVQGYQLFSASQTPKVGSKLASGFSITALMPTRNCLLYASVLADCGFVSRNAGVDLVSFRALQTEHLGTLCDAAAQLAKLERESTRSIVDVFVAAGQSNMAGRGLLDDRCLYAGQAPAVADSVSSPGVLSFDPVEGWKVADACSHRNVDILKNVGVGPANSFAASWLRCAATDPGTGDSDGAAKAVGIIPVAIGATSIAEWLPDYNTAAVEEVCSCGGTGNRLCVACINMHFSASGNIQARALDGSVREKTNLYHSGCPNIFSCALRSVYLSLACVGGPAGSKRGGGGCKSFLRGILWYQGCNDAGADANDQAGYAAKVTEFFTVFQLSIRVIQEFVEWEFCRAADSGGMLSPELAMRGRSHRKFAGDDVDIAAREEGGAPCHPRGIPAPSSLPVVTVAITTTRERLTGLKAIRSIQLDYPSSGACAAWDIGVVDAFGSWLNSDNIHLHSISSTVLGELMCAVMVRLVEKRAVSGDGCPRMLEALNRFFYNRACEQMLCDFESCFSTMNRIVSGYTNEEYSAALNGDLQVPPVNTMLEGQSADRTSGYQCPIFSSNTTAGADVANDKAGIDRAAAKQMKPASSNFVSGEISCQSMCGVVALALQGISKSCQLGARAGDCSFATSYDCNFVDLGCGIGIPMASFLLSYQCYLGLLSDSVSRADGSFGALQPVRVRLVGLDMMKSKLIEAKCLLTETLRCVKDRDQAAAAESACAFKVEPDIKLIHGNFLEQSVAEKWYNDADVPASSLVYVCATCYDRTTLNGIYLHISKGMPLGTRILIMDKKLEYQGDLAPSSVPPPPAGEMKSNYPALFGSLNEEQLHAAREHFQLVNSCQAKVSWGEASVYIYEKIV